MRTRSWSVGLGLLLLAACGGRHELERGADAASSPSDGSATDSAAALVEDAAADGPDAGALAPGFEGGIVDAASAAADAGPDAALRADGQVVTLHEAGVVACSLEAGAGDASCDGVLCSTDSGPFVSLHREEGWSVGALGWNAAVCARTLGWPSSSSADGRDILFAVSPRDMRELAAGAPLFVGYGNPSSVPDQRIARCTLAMPTPLAACPITPYPPIHQSLVGCRGPSDVNCGACSVPGAQAWYRSTSDGANWYNRSSAAAPASCAAPCLPCASCTHRDEQMLKALPARPECEPCPDDQGIDPCYRRDSCECWCSNSQRLTTACPTFAP